MPAVSDNLRSDSLAVFLCWRMNSPRSAQRSDGSLAVIRPSLEQDVRVRRSDFVPFDDCRLELVNLIVERSAPGGDAGLGGTEQPGKSAKLLVAERSEERRVGKECK